jgi:DNA-binding ferritin-like protein (oxidative damage protectant)
MPRTTTATERTTRVTRRSTEIEDGPSRLYSTKNDLPQASRVQVIELLNQRLADSIDLQTQCKQAHWNVKGPAFIALHKLFDEINEDVEEYVDLIAERIVQLGGIAEGTVGVVTGRTSWWITRWCSRRAPSMWRRCRTRLPHSGGPYGSGSRR